MTHINAYFVDVDEKLEAVRVAQAEYEAARSRLEAKKLEEGWSEPEVVEEAKTEEKPKEEKKKIFDNRR